jgi:hypothetical protein
MPKLRAILAAFSFMVFAVVVHAMPEGWVG